MKNKLFSVIAITLLGMMLIACSSSNSDKIDKALDKIEKAIEDKKIEKADELLDEFDDRFDDNELSESQAIRRQCIMIAIVESYSNYDYEQEAVTNSHTNKEKYFSYKVLLNDGYFCGLAILYGEDDNMQYLKFDDEATFYNDCIYEWYLAYKMAYNLWNYNKYLHDENEIIKFCGGDIKLKEQKINSYLNCAHCMPDCLDKYVADDIALEVFRKTYYDIRDIGIYEPERRYGEWKYPYDENYDSYIGSYRYIILERIDNDRYGVPKEILSIKNY